MNPKVKKGIAIGCLVLFAFAVIIVGILVYASYRSSIEGASYEADYRGVDYFPSPSKTSYVESLTADGESYFKEESYQAAEFDNSTETSQPTDSTPFTTRMVIKNGSVSMYVDDLDVASEGVQNLVSKYSGYLISVSDTGSGNYRHVEVAIKVEAKNFDAAIMEIKNLADEVSSVNVSAEDITQTYTDMQSRLKNLKASEEEMVRILSKAEKVADILAIQTELNKLRGEIEVLEGQIRYYDNNVAYSTISVSMSLKPENVVLEEEKWRPLAVAKDAVRALVGMLQGLVNLVIWLIILSPIFFLIFVVPVLVVKRIIKRRREKRGQAKKEN